MTLRIGIAGLGLAGRSLLPAIAAHPAVTLAGGADDLPAARDAFTAETGAPVYPGVTELAAAPDVDAVYIATPTDLHAEHVDAVAAAGKHILVEKPMAIDLSQAQRMIDAAARAGVVLVVGHSHSFDRPYQVMREIIASGRLGRARILHNLYYSDWLYRPRRPEELLTERGGGVTLRQGAHQFDILRLLGGGLVERVRAVTFDWDPARSAIGAHTAFLTFADGAVATAIYNGYGAFLSAEICYGIGESGHLLGTASAGQARRAFRERPPGAELAVKRSTAARAHDETNAPHQPFFGWTMVSCEGGDIRQSPDGVYVYTERGREDVVLPLEPRPRAVVLAEFTAAVAGERSPLHDGRWGRANLEVCVAAITSSQSGQDVVLKHQVAVPD